ncbi:MAG: methylenetetrahydrofolate reductase [Clostridiales bacterium]|nr:methylenetetrahydrofolate reductase [Clostridiales bacterium]
MSERINAGQKSGDRYASRLQAILESGEFAVCSEMGPPMSANASFIKEKADMLRGYVDTVNITDNQTAIVRMSSIAAAVITKAEGLEPVMQATCRDRNRIALQSDILGASALGIRNILCLTGDHQTFGSDPGSKNVFDLDSVQLIKGVRGMVDGRFMNGKEIKSPPVMFVGGAYNPFSDPQEMHMIKLQKKINAGMQFIQTQAVYNTDAFEAWMSEVRRLGLHKKVHILAGILPTKSVKALKMMKQHVAGMDVPDSVIERMEKSSDPEKEGVRMAVDIIERIRSIEGVAGVHLMPVGWEQITPVVVKEAGLYPRPEVTGEW